MHGVVHLKGRLDHLRGHDVDLREEVEIILRIIRGKPGIRDVVNEMELGRMGLRDSVRASLRAKRRY
jgi:hypothetical protein